LEIAYSNEDAPAKVPARGIWGWMLFDWAAQPFFTVVTTFIFGPYFVSRLTSDPVAAQAAWSNTATISSIIIALLSPVLGSIADQSGARKPWIGFFAVIKITCLFGLWYASPGSPIIWPVVLMIFASVSAEFSIVFNDSMMPRLVSKDEVGRLSNTAWGLGYLGGMIRRHARHEIRTEDEGGDDREEGLRRPIEQHQAPHPAPRHGGTIGRHGSLRKCYRR